MKRIFILLALVSAVIFTSCGASVRIYTDLEDSAHFESYKTYTFLDFTDGNKKTITGMELERIRIAFAREIEQRGFRFSEEQPDVTIQITVYHKQSMDHSYYYYPPRSYMERAIAVDMFDVQMQKHVWHGAAVGELAGDPADRAENFPKVATAIFEKYPVQPAVEHPHN
ncbi:MAG: DUF4136 domain-containing protein [Bacteroidetes bacterium]|nr:DUF4136 domain-containing protein [Bacteroidota bacterium]